MGMKGQIPSPGVQNSHHANLSSNIFGIKSQSLGSCRGGAKESAVE